MSACGVIERQRIIPVLRCRDESDALATARAASRAGFELVELTFTTPHVLDVVPTLVEEGLTVALGTVTSAEQVAAAARAGATAVVSFSLPDQFMVAAADAGVDAIPGALTPTEILLAHEAGAALVKLFPARLAGVAMMADIAAVLPTLRLLPTGGISAEDAPQWLAAGAVAVGLGSCLSTAASSGAEEVERRCRAALRAVQAVPRPR